MFFAEGGRLLDSKTYGRTATHLAAINQDMILHMLFYGNNGMIKIAYLHSFVVNHHKRGVGLGRSFFVKVRQYLINMKIDLLQLTLEDLTNLQKNLFNRS